MRFICLSRHPRWLEPVQDLMGGPVYIHQSRLNPKAAFHGGPWDWHQDYATWSNRDGLREPRAFMVAILLDEANAANGPLMLVPGSHHYGLIAEAADNRESPGYTLFVISEEHLTHIVDAGGIEPFVGPGRVGPDHPRQHGPRLGRQHHPLAAPHLLSQRRRGR